jgi:glycosyltransferase involved in cell wall biosynthesis
MSASARSDLLASVIVPARNAADQLRELIDALQKQTLPRDRFEVVIGDDGSTDESIAALATDDGWIRVVPGPPLNSYAARNRAVRASRGPVLAFCDSDCQPEPEWLEEGLRALGGLDLAAGRIRFILPERRTIWTLLDMDGSKDHEREVRQGNAETANLFLGRVVYDAVGGFEDVVTEHGDFDFVERSLEHGFRLGYVPDAVVWHPARTRARHFLRAVWIYSRGYAEREARRGRVPEGLWLRSWVPLVQTIRARRRWGLSLGPDRRWLGANNVRPRLSETLAVLPVMYLVMPYMRSAAQLVGWWAGRRAR